MLAALREMRGGALQCARFGERMQGSGPRWEALRQLFHIQCRRRGLEPDARFGAEPAGAATHQGELFER